MRIFSFSSFLLVVIAGTSLCYGRNSSMSPNGNACEFLSKAEAESILGTPVKLHAQNPYECWYVGSVNWPVNNKMVHLVAGILSSPDPNSYVESKKAWTTPPYGDPGAVITDIPNFEDAALWTWAGTGGTLGAFKGGTISVNVTVVGIPEAPALRAAKALTAKVLGGTVGTGYVYLGAPKSNVAAAQAAPAAHRVRKTARVAVQARQSASNGLFGAYCVAGISNEIDSFSDAFGTPESDPGTIFKAFKPYLAHKYSKPLRAIGGSCRTFSTVEKARAARQEQMAMYRQGERANPPGPKVEETDWKYAAPPTAGAQSAAESKATAAATTPNGEKTACQLIAKSSLESILGFQYGDPRSVPVDKDSRDRYSLSAPFGSLGVIASSSCQYATAPAGKSGVTLTVWYTKQLDPELAKDYFFHYLRELRTGRDDVTSPSFPYPAAWRNTPSGTYFFKGGPNGLTILMVHTYVMPQDSNSGEEVYVARAKKIVLKIWGLPKPSKSLAASSPAGPGGIVTKPRVYWDTYYRSAIIRQVFNGDYVPTFDTARQFKMLFTSYVEMFSAHCSAYLPAQHDSFTITSPQTGTASTVEVDPRFSQKYQQFFNSLIVNAEQSPADAMAIASGRVDARDYFAPGTDVGTFFKIEKCQSPAMRQLGRNLLQVVGN